MSLRTKLWPAVILLLLLSLVGTCQGGEEPGPDPTVDAIEQTLETGRHQKLLDRIAENGTTMTGFQPMVVVADSRLVTAPILGP